MKGSLLILSITSLILLSCNKGDTIKLKEDNGCIERKILRVDQHSVSIPDIAIINNLFISNNIDINKYRYYKYEQDSVQTYFPPFARFDSKLVRVDQYANGLRIFNADRIFIFKNNVLDFVGGNATDGTSLNTNPKLNIAQVRKLFIDAIEQYDHKGNQNKDTCLSAEFGYYNLNAGTGNSTEVLIKAWRVTRKNSTYPSEYPVAYFRDDDGKLIYYFNGIIVG
jgi:hypothetical protein